LTPPRSNLTVRLGLAGLCLLAAVVRFWGLWYGLPHPLARPDEEIVVGQALEISISPIRDPAAFPYPKLVYYTDPVKDRPIRRDTSKAYPYPDLVYYVDGLAMTAWRTAGHWLGAYASTDDFVADIAVRQSAIQYRIGRGVSGLAGTATVLAAFAAALCAYRRRSVALVAGLLVAVNYLHARDSHYATVDVPMTLLVTWSLAFALKAAATGARRDVLLSAGFAGLATSAKFNAATVILSTVMAAGRRWFALSSALRKRTIVTLVLAAIVMGAAFALTSPDCVRHYKIVLTGLARQRHVLFGTDNVPAWRVFLSTTFPVAFGWPGLIAVCAGLVRAIWKRRPADLVLLAFIVPTFASMAGMTWVLPRYPLPLIPAFCVLAAEVSVTALPSLRWGWVLALVAVLAGPPLRTIVTYDRLASARDTRLLASDWVNTNVSGGAAVAVCRGYGAPALASPPGLPVAFTATTVGSGVDSTRGCTLADLEGSGARYVITHTHPYIKYFPPADDAAGWLRSHAQPVASFSPFSAEGAERGMDACFYPGDAFYLPYCRFDGVARGGPIVTIWRVD
jgi:hypothetical protein